MKNILYLFALAILFGRCATSKESIANKSTLKKEILGTQIWGIYKGEIQATQYNKNAKFIEDKPGIQFLTDGKIVKRQNSGFCGTPPISYEQREGAWEITSDSTLTIKYEYWGGKTEEDWKIIQLDDKTMRCQIVDSRTQRNNEGTASEKVDE